MDRTRPLFFNKRFKICPYRWDDVIDPIFGCAFTSHITPPVSSHDFFMSGNIKSIPLRSKPMTFEALIANVLLSG